MSDITIVYYTDNSLPPEFEVRCQRELAKSAQGKRIISVSQKPLDFGDNICLPFIGRNLRSLFLQPLVGVLAAETKYIALAEHDCFYHPSHFDWRPDDDSVFWYDVNHWFVKYETGDYAYYRRKPMSMLICTRAQFIPAVYEKIEMFETGFRLPTGGYGVCEPGVIDGREDFKMARSEWWLRMKDVGKEPMYMAKGFRAELPSLDIRHGHNYSGNLGAYIRRARHKTDCLEPWGKFKEYWENG